MGLYLDQLQSGSVNVQINDDTGVDWALYVATVATPLAGAGGAMVFVDGGGSVTLDAAIAPLDGLQVGGGAGGELVLRDAAAVSVVGDYLQIDNGTLRVELNDAFLGGPMIDVANLAMLDGKLEVELAPDYVPALNDTFEILTAAGGLIGELDLVDPTISSQLVWELESVGGSVLLKAVANGLVGDYNDDGQVDAGDYTVWRNHLGQTFTLTNENPAAATPGVVDAEDFAFWKAHFGEIAGSGPGAGANAAVPEATSRVLLMTVVLAMFVCRRAAVS